MVLNINTINKWLAIVLAILIVVIGILEFRRQYLNQFKYDWSYIVIGVKNQPMQLYNVSLLQHFDEGMIMQHGWDKINSGDTSFNRNLPENFKVEWFAYNENKFYKAKINFQKKELEALAKKMKEEYRKKERSLFIRIYAELKPKGIVTMWIFNGTENQEICTVQGEENQVEWGKLVTDSKYSREEWINMVKKGTI